MRRFSTFLRGAMAAWVLQVSGADAQGVFCAERPQITTVDEPATQHLSHLRVSGDHLFASKRDQLVVIDISNPHDPLVLSTLTLGTGDVSGLRLLGETAVVAMGRTLHTIDISDVSRPIQIGTYTASEYLGPLAADGAVAFVAEGSRGLRAIDLTDPAQPTPLGDHFGLSRSVALDLLNGLLIGLSTGGAYTYDVSSPDSPVQTSDLLLAGSGLTDVCLDEGTAFVWSDAGLWVLDVSSPDDTRIIGELFAPGSEGFLWKEGSRLFATNWNERVRVIDVQNARSPAIIGERSLDQLRYFAVRDGTIYTSMADQGLGVFDLSDPVGPPLMSRIGIGVDWMTVSEPFTYAINSNGLVVLELLENLPPRMRARYPLPSPTDSALGNDRLFIADGFLGLITMNMSEPERPLITNIHPLGGDPGQMDVDGDLLAIRVGNEVRLYNIEEPDSPRFVGVDPDSVTPSDLDLRGPLLAYADSYDGFHLRDVSDPSAPAELSHFDISGGARRVLLGDGYGVVGADPGPADTMVLDLSDPVNPRHVSTIPVDGFDRVSLQRDVLTIPGDQSRFYDLSDPTRPVRLGAYAGRSTQGHLISGSRAIVASDGIQIIDLTDCPPCPADWNEDGAIDSRDVVRFVADWASERDSACESGCRSDLNGDGTVDTQDFLLFLNLWTGGCDE